ncbi:hypothetical protein DY000_02003682, partial [Brassica cretica]
SEDRKLPQPSLCTVSLFRPSSFTCGNNATTSSITRYPSPQLKSSVLLTATFGPPSLPNGNERTSLLSCLFGLD